MDIYKSCNYQFNLLGFNSPLLAAKNKNNSQTK